MPPKPGQPSQDPISKVFPIGRKIDLAFNFESLRPLVRSTIINECDYELKNMVLSQSNPQILPSFKRKIAKLTTLIRKKDNELIRIGVECRIKNFIDDYLLSDGKKEKSVLVGYHLPLKESNIRGAYRIRPNPKYTIKGKITIGGQAYISGKAFNIKDVSGTGIGIPVPKITNNQSNPIYYLEKGNEVRIELILADRIREYSVSIATAMKVVRNNNYLSRIRAFIGARYLGINPGDEERLFQFIHEAQQYEIRKMLGDE